MEQTLPPGIEIWELFSSDDKKEHVLEDPLPEEPADNANATTKNAYQKLVDESMEISCLMLALYGAWFATTFRKCWGLRYDRESEEHVSDIG